MNKLSEKNRTLILNLLIEGNSLRTTARIAGVSRNTVEKVLHDVGLACLDYQNKHLRNLSCKRIQCDQIWSFACSTNRNISEDKNHVMRHGDIWTWVAIDTDTKLVLCWHIGTHDAKSAHIFIKDLSKRLNDYIQLTTDDHKVYFNVVENPFATDIDYAILVKAYGDIPSKNKRNVSPQYTYKAMHMSMCHFTGLASAFSKKASNHMCAISFHYMYYNFVRTHQSLKATPAMEAGLTDRVWNLEEVTALASIKPPKKYIFEEKKKQ